MNILYTTRNARQLADHKMGRGIIILLLLMNNNLYRRLCPQRSPTSSVV